jgi:hypothetical protein
MIDTKNQLLKSFYSNFKLNKNITSKLQKFTTHIYNEVNLQHDDKTNYSKDHFNRVKTILKEQFDYYWKKQIFCDDNSKGIGGNKMRTYRQFKRSIKFENYLNLSSTKSISTIAKFRLSCHKLNIETMRYSSEDYIPPENRLCEQCTLSRVEDEQHSLITCPHYETLRNDLFNVSTITENNFFVHYNDYQKFLWIMTNEELDFIKNYPFS